jgi:hypothetical protein
VVLIQIAFAPGTVTVARDWASVPTKYDDVAPGAARPT